MKHLNSTSFYRNSTFSSVFVKFGVCFLLLGLAFRMFSSTFVQFSSVADHDDEPAFSVDLDLPSLAAEPPGIPDEAAVKLDKQHSTPNEEEDCDLFVGDWVPNPNGPLYTNTTCYTIEAPQNCMKNGRPDSDYVYWRWKPKDCSLPRFDAQIFLNIMRHKSLAFIGDSIMRNHVQSLLCVLSQVEQAVEVYHDEAYKNRRWSFPDHQFTVSVVWAPFLAEAFTFEDDNGVSSGLIQLHLDKLDTVWTQQYESFDFVMIAGGKWFLKSALYYENNTVVGCHNCNDKNVTQLGFMYAYRRVLNTTMRFITGSEHRPNVFIRTTTPDHFENGEWNTGGYCNRTQPFQRGEIEISYIDDMLRKIELDEFQWAEAAGSGNGLILKLFDSMLLSLLRPDGHPGVYRQFHPYAGKDKNAKIQNDCLHWCLPGPIDAWNDVMLEMLLRGSSG